MYNIYMIYIYIIYHIYIYIYIYIYIFLKAGVTTMCDIFKVTKNPFFCFYFQSH